MLGCLGKFRHLETHTLLVRENVRTGAIRVRKVQGDINPTDLFAKHLPNSIKIGQLVKLFGCDDRECRSSAAPVLRPHNATGGEVGQPLSGHLLTFEFREAGMFDPGVLPHMHEPR